MNIENQVCSLELSKKLKELGVKQESLFWWSYYPHVGHYALEYQPEGMSNFNISAFTVAELGEMLPRQFDYQVDEKIGGTRPLILSCGRTIMGGWYILYNDPHPANKFPYYSEHANTEADARAKMLIFLLNNKLIGI